MEKVENRCKKNGVRGQAALPTAEPQPPLPEPATASDIPLLPSSISESKGRLSFFFCHQLRTHIRLPVIFYLPSVFAERCTYRGGFVCCTFHRGFELIALLLVHCKHQACDSISLADRPSGSFEMNSVQAFVRIFRLEMAPENTGGEQGD